MKNIALTGFMGAGKTTVGKKLAEKLNMIFIDCDSYIEENEGISIAEIFKNFGEEHFRNLEKKAIKKICEKSGQVIALGGGAVLNSENAAILKNTCIIIYLEITTETVTNRIFGDKKRPLLKNEDEIRSLLLKRQPYYIKIADIIINANGSCDDTIKLIVGRGFTPAAPLVIKERYMKNK